MLLGYDILSKVVPCPLPPCFMLFSWTGFQAHSVALQSSGGTTRNSWPLGGIVKVTQSYPTLCDPMDCPWNSLGQNTGVGSHIPSPGDLPNPGIEPGLLHCRWILYQLSHKGSSRILEWAAYSFSRRSSWPRNRTRVSCIAGGYFTNWDIRVHVFLNAW